MFMRIESLLNVTRFKDFEQGFLDLYDDFLCNQLSLEAETSPIEGKLFCNIYRLWNLTSISVQKISRPSHVRSPQAVAKILHAVAHIEMSAIVLSLDSAYRFRNMPRQYYADWLTVVHDETRHFNLLNDLLCELGYCYGDFCVHDELFSALCVTQDSLEVRMGVVHRGLEARGLDANPFVQRKLLETTLSLRSKIRDVLNIILDDEIEHVSKGDIWWKQYSRKPFIELCKEFQFRLAGKILNKEARKQAGFSDEEIQSLENFYTH